MIAPSAQPRIVSPRWQRGGWILLTVLCYVLYLNVLTLLLWGVFLHHASAAVVNIAILTSVSFTFAIIAVMLLPRVTVWQTVEQITPLWMVCFFIGLMIIVMFRLAYSTVYLAAVVPGSLIMLVGLIKILAYAVRERILVLDGASIGDQEHHSGEIIIGYDAALMPQRIDTLIAASSHFKDPYWCEILRQATINQIPIILDSEYRETLQGRVDLTLIDAEKLIEMRSAHPYLVIKRMIDLVLATCGIILLAPLMIIVAVLIRCETPGNPIFIQERVGFKGKSFKMLKFRSMIRDADRDGARFTDIGDLRITRIGKIIRIPRIDEVPQLFNILFGTMSLIGPRPEQKAFVDKLEDEIPLYTFRHAVRPGITGWAQVMQGYADDVASTNTKLSFDLFYIKNMSLMMDTVIFIKTLKTIFTGFGAR